MPLNDPSKPTILTTMIATNGGYDLDDLSDLGLLDLDPANLAAYEAAIANAAPTPTTVAELQAIITAVNSGEPMKWLYLPLIRR